jgi:hypothetical protein
MSETHQNQSFEEARAGLPDASPHHSVIWKPLHRLLNEGNPVDPVTVLCFDMGDGRLLPFSSLGMTRGNRLVLWPPSDERKPGTFADGYELPIHHVTLELGNGQTHFTHFERTGSRVHENRGWRLPPGDAGLRMWLIGAVQIAQLEMQAGALEMGVNMPASDSERRIDEYKRYFAKMKLTPVNAPALEGDFLITVMYLIDGGLRRPIEPADFPVGACWNEWVDGSANGEPFAVVRTDISVSGVSLLLLTAGPPGRLKGGCFLGGAVRRRN